MFLPPGASIPVTSSSPLHRYPCTPLYPHFLPRSMGRPFFYACVFNLGKRSRIFHSRVSFVTLAPTRKVPRTNGRQNVEIVGIISQCHGRHA